MCSAPQKKKVSGMGSSKFLFSVLAVVIAILAATLGPAFLGNDSILMSETSVNIDGMPFPSDIKIAGSKQSLLGGGTRSKWGFRVYAVGIFSDTKLVKSLKKKYVGDVTGSNLSNDFSESKLARTLLLRFHREVASSDISEALGEALIDKVGEDTSKKFQTFILDMVEKQGKNGFVKGSDLYITCKGEKLWASLSEGKDASTISMKGLCSAIFMVYLGSSPVSPQAKEGFERGFSDLVFS
ncbi:hypothetical protein ACHAXR_011314 [Thalassiosira sp. AJA248-18]